jgi:cytochrome P450
MDTEMPKLPSRDILNRDLNPSIELRVAWFHHMQTTQPILYRPEYNLWEVFRYKDVQQVLSDYAVFSVDECLPEDLPFLLGKSDPPRHRQFRSLVSKAFTPRRVEELTPRIIQIVDELLAPAISRGTMNLVTELVYPLPIRVIGAMLGLPPQDQERITQWSHQLLRQFIGIWEPTNNELIQYFSDLLDERKCNPQDDLMSGLLMAEENGVHLTREEIITLCLELLTAGSVTVMMMLSPTFLRFCQYPELSQTLRDDPSLIPGAIEETLRYDCSFFHQWRMASHDTVLNGHEIKAGQYVVARTGAANFDETYFPHPEQFDIRRSPNPHLNFGHGIHTCLGNPLARLEGRIALERIIAHFSEIHLAPEKPVQYMDQMGVLPFMQSLDILCTPAESDSQSL